MDAGPRPLPAVRDAYPSPTLVFEAKQEPKLICLPRRQHTRPKRAGDRANPWPAPGLPVAVIRRRFSFATNPNFAGCTRGWMWYKSFPYWADYATACQHEPLFRRPFRAAGKALPGPYSAAYCSAPRVRSQRMM